MTDFSPIDGNPAETVGDTRMTAAEESDRTLRIRSIPRTLEEVLIRHLTGTHVLVGMFAALGVEALLAVLANALFPRADLNLVFAVMFGTILVVSSILFFRIVNRDEDEKQPRTGSPTTLTIESESFEVTSEGWFGPSTRLSGEAWDLVETLRRLNRARIAPSTEFVATLRPTGSLRSYLVTALTERDRTWLERQLEVEQ